MTVIPEQHTQRCCDRSITFFKKTHIIFHCSNKVKSYSVFIVNIVNTERAQGSFFYPILASFLLCGLISVFPAVFNKQALITDRQISSSYRY